MNHNLVFCPFTGAAGMLGSADEASQDPFDSGTEPMVDGLCVSHRTAGKTDTLTIHCHASEKQHDRLAGFHVSTVLQGLAAAASISRNYDLEEIPTHLAW